MIEANINYFNKKLWVKNSKNGFKLSAKIVSAFINL